MTFTVLFLSAGLLYIYAPVQLCNNYLLIEQITLGWGFVLTAICMAIYLIYELIVTDRRMNNVDVSTSSDGVYNEVKSLQKE